MKPSQAGSITLEQLIALNDEIGALVRAGVPLEQGLAQLGEDLPGRLGQLARSIAARMERGESLSQVLGDQSPQIPPVYRAVVEAGARSGRLAAALESVAASARRIAETRRLVALSLVYPLLLFLLAWGLFVLFVTALVPRLVPVFEDFDAYGLGLLRSLAAWGESAAYWGTAVPLVVVVVAGVWWRQSTRGAMAEPRTAGFLLGWLPGIGRMLRTFHTAAFSEVLALLVENRVPLHEGLVLAAETAGDPRILRSARTLADALQRGQTDCRGDADSRHFPPLVRWMMQVGQHHGSLGSALRHAAEMYRQRAIYEAAAARLFVPVLLTVVVGGGIVVSYVAMVFGPWIAMLYSLSRT